MTVGIQLGPLILLFIALALAALAAIFYLIYVSRQRAAKVVDQRKLNLKERYLSALWGSAVVISSSSMDINGPSADEVQVKLTLDVETPKGDRYPAKATWTVDPNFLHFLRPGETIPIRIDSLDGMRIYPNVDWAESLEWEEK
jgi:hypothetical protein